MSVKQKAYLKPAFSDCDEAVESSPLLVAQIGVGNFGASRRRSLHETGLFKMVALYDWNERFLAAAAAEEGAHACSSYEEMLEMPGLEAVIVSTGAKYHAKQVIAALRRGLPVFVEKPLCSTPEELRELLAVQRETGLPVGVGHADHRTQPLSKAIKALLDTGELGAIVAFEKTTAHSGGLHIKAGDWRGDPEKNPGGMLFHCGIHALHELMFYFGPISEISARMRYDVNETRTADAALCQIVFESGIAGTLCAYHVTAYRHTLAIFGTQANIYRDERYYEEGTKVLKQMVNPHGSYEAQIPLEIKNTDSVHHGNIRAFYKAVRSGIMQYPSLIDGARAVAAVFAAEEAARTGRGVKMDLRMTDGAIFGPEPGRNGNSARHSPAEYAGEAVSSD